MIARAIRGEPPANVARLAVPVLVAVSGLTIIALTALLLLDAPRPIVSVLQVVLIASFLGLALLDLRAAVAIAMLELAVAGASGQWTRFPGGISGRVALDMTVALAGAIWLLRDWRRHGRLELGRYGAHALAIAVLLPLIWMPSRPPQRQPAARRCRGRQRAPVPCLLPCLHRVDSPGPRSVAAELAACRLRGECDRHPHDDRGDPGRRRAAADARRHPVRRSPCRQRDRLPVERCLPLLPRQRPLPPGRPCARGLEAHAATEIGPVLDPVRHPPDRRHGNIYARVLDRIRAGAGGRAGPGIGVLAAGGHRGRGVSGRLRARPQRSPRRSPFRYPITCSSERCRSPPPSRCQRSQPNPEKTERARAASRLTRRGRSRTRSAFTRHRC